MNSLCPLAHPMAAGQSFRWRQTGEGEFTGVVGRRAVRHLRQHRAAPMVQPHRTQLQPPRCHTPASPQTAPRTAPRPPPASQVVLRQLPDDVQYRIIARGTGADPAGDASALADYFNLSHRLAELAPSWCSACARYAAVHPLLPGARMLRQDPVECLFQVGGRSGGWVGGCQGDVQGLL